MANSPHHYQKCACCSSYWVAETSDSSASLYCPSCQKAGFGNTEPEQNIWQRCSVCHSIEEVAKVKTVSSQFSNQLYTHRIHSPLIVNAIDSDRLFWYHHTPYY